MWKLKFATIRIKRNLGNTLFFYSLVLERIFVHKCRWWRNIKLMFSIVANVRWKNRMSRKILKKKTQQKNRNKVVLMATCNNKLYVQTCNYAVCTHWYKASSVFVLFCRKRSVLEECFFLSEKFPIYPRKLSFSFLRIRSTRR